MDIDKIQNTSCMYVYLDWKVQRLSEGWHESPSRNSFQSFKCYFGERYGLLGEMWSATQMMFVLL